MIYLISNQTEAFQSSAYKKATLLDLVTRFKDQDVLGVDTETGGFDPYTVPLLMLQIGDATDQYVIDTTTVSIWPLKSLLESKELIFHNAKFDLRFLYHQGIVPKRVFDTYLAERILSTGIDSHRKGLEACLKRHVNPDIQMDKSIRLKIKLNTESILYAADDVRHLPELREKQMKKLAEQKLTNTMILDNQFVRVLAYVEYSGIYLDKSAWTKKAKEDLEDKAIKESACNSWIASNLTGTKFVNDYGDLFNPHPQAKVNLSSPKQCVELFDYLGLDLWVNDKGKQKQSVESGVLKPQKDKSPLVELYLSYKEAEKLCSTYGHSFLKQVNPVTQRIHTQYTQIMNTGRLSSGGKDKALKIDLVNMQNIPSDHRHRSCFTAQKGNILVDADYSGQEQIVLANFSQEPSIIEFYRKGLGDMHSYVCSKIFPELDGMDLNEIKEKHKDKRQIAKAAGFAINYGGNGQTIANNLSIPVEQGNKVYDAYFEAFPKLKDYFKKCQNYALKHGHVFFNTITGRKSFVDFYDEYRDLKMEIDEPGFWSVYRQEKKDNTPYYEYELKGKVRKYFNYKGMIERKSLNYPIQGTSADITKIAGVYFMSWLEETNQLFEIRICNLIHDEILIEVPKDKDVQMVADKLKECMEKAGSFFCPIIPLEAEPSISEFWTH